MDQSSARVRTGCRVMCRNRLALLLTINLLLVLRCPSALASQSKDKLSSWQNKPFRWKRWYHYGLAQAANLSDVVNSIPSDLKGGGWEYLLQRYSGNSTDMPARFDFPVLVQNLPFRKDRGMSTEKMLKGLGFTNVIFPSLTPAEDLDVDKLLQGNRVVGQLQSMLISNSEKKPGSVFAAVALDHCRLVTRMSRLTEGLFGIFEDDLMMSQEPRQLAIRLKKTLEELPSDADMLFLEYCGENCTELHYPPGGVNIVTQIAKASRPKCHGALIYTSHGARKAAELCTTASDVNDLMYAEKIRSGLLKAYVATPPLFYQDGAWGTNVGRHGASMSDFSPHTIRAETRSIHTPCSDEEVHSFFKSLGLAWVIRLDENQRKSEEWDTRSIRCSMSATSMERLDMPSSAVELIFYTKGVWNLLQQCEEQGPDCEIGFAIQVGTMNMGDPQVHLYFDPTSVCHRPLAQRLQSREAHEHQDHADWTENDGSSEEFFCPMEISVNDDSGDEITLIQRTFAVVL